MQASKLSKGSASSLWVEISHFSHAGTFKDIYILNTNTFEYFGDITFHRIYTHMKIYENMYTYTQKNKGYINDATIDCPQVKSQDCKMVNERNCETVEEEECSMVSLTFFSSIYRYIVLQNIFAQWRVWQRILMI